MKKLIKSIMFVLALGAFSFTGCDNGSSDPSHTSPDVWGGLLNGSSLKGSYAVAGSSFDGATAVIIGSASGSRQTISMTTDTLPAGIKTVFIDWPSLQTIGNDVGGTLSFPVANLDRLYDWTKQGATLVFNKPESFSVITILTHIQDRLNYKTINTSQQRQSLQQKQTSAGEFGELDWDIVAIKPDASAYYLNRMDNTGKTSTVNVVTETSIDDESPTTTETTETVTDTTPSTEDYALFAKEAVKWLNESQTQALQRYKQAEGSDSNSINQVCNYTITINCTAFTQKGRVTMPLTLRVWTTTMYNFSAEEDYYHVLMEEEFDPSPMYFDEFYKDGNNFTGVYRKGGYTWNKMNFHIRWPFSDYTVRDLWNIQPENKAEPVTTESIRGWSVNAEIGGSKKGVTGKLSGSYSAEEHVKKVENDVSVTYNTNVGNEKWLQWFYSFGHQSSYSGKMSKWEYSNPPSNATSRSRSCQRQSWNWVINNTKKRGSEPFYFIFQLFDMGFQMGRVQTGGVAFQTDHKTIGYAMKIDGQQYNIPLPVPERYKHTYSLTTDDVGDTTEFNHLMTTLSNVSSNFDQLRAKLIRKDSSGSICGRTGVSEEALVNMVGNEWYDLAKEVAGKKIAVNKTYKFYVKDENGNKLPMRNLAKQTKKLFGFLSLYEWESPGTYLVISPAGISITDN